MRYFLIPFVVFAVILSCQKQSGDVQNIPPVSVPRPNSNMPFLNNNDSLEFTKTIRFIDEGIAVNDSLILVIERLLHTSDNGRLIISDFKTQVLLDRLYKLDKDKSLEIAIQNFDVLTKSTNLDPGDNVLGSFPFLSFIAENYSVNEYLFHLIKSSKFKKCENLTMTNRNSLILNYVIVSIISQNVVPKDYDIHYTDLMAHLDHLVNSIKNNTSECYYQNTLKLKESLENYYNVKIKIK